jgi:hypothetical protein
MVARGLLLIAALLASPAVAQSGGNAPQQRAAKPNILVTPPPTKAERREELRDFAREVIRPPRMRHPVAKFAFPVCVEVRGLTPEDGEAVAERIRENAEALGVGADRKPGCVPTVRVAFMGPAAGPPEGWLSATSPQLAHLASYQRERVLAESGPVRAWNRIVVRDINGQPFMLDTARAFGDQSRFPDWTPIDRQGATDPMVTTEITGAAVLISREAADGFTLAQLADYATMRSLVGTAAPEGEVPAPTILTLFDDADPPAGLTAFDTALARNLYDAARNATPRRVFNDIARAALAAERGSDPRGN